MVLCFIVVNIWVLFFKYVVHLLSLQAAQWQKSSTKTVAYCSSSWTAGGSVGLCDSLNITVHKDCWCSFINVTSNINRIIMHSNNRLKFTLTLRVDWYSPVLVTLKWKIELWCVHSLKTVLSLMLQLQSDTNNNAFELVTLNSTMKRHTDPFRSSCHLD